MTVSTSGLRSFLRTLPYIAASTVASFLCTAPATAQSGLNITYGGKGIQTLSFQGQTLEDMGSNPGDVFHIYHLKTTDLNGNVLGCAQCGWGENNNGESWNAQTLTETYTFSWGSIAVQFAQSGANLNMTVTETNNSNSGLILDGAEILPLALHFPQDPAGFSGYTQYAITSTGPGVSVADYGSGVVTSVLPNESKPLYGGWLNVGNATYEPLMTSTAPDGLASFLPSNDVPVQPGSSFTYSVSLRFTPEGTAANASDGYASFVTTYPSQMTWTDKRIIGTAYLASSPANTGDKTASGGFPHNPRRYFNDPTVDVTTPAGLQGFQDRILTQAATNVSTSRAMSSQGVITWDLEGEQYPQDTSYVCSPDQIASVAPEMESIITDATSPYVGQKLDDAYFKIMSSAGLRVGLCLRPQQFQLNQPSAGHAQQVYLTGNASIIANLETKARFANSRWGATIFYVDSTVDSNGGTLDPAIFQQLITDFPNFLFIPEESTPRYYAYSAPFYSFIFHGTTGTPASTYQFYPKAFGANLVNDVAPGTLAAAIPQLTQSVAAGDILMGHADYLQANDPTLVSIYAAAGINPLSPIQVTPAISWAPPGSIAYGTPLSAAQLNASATVPGAFTYNPAAGTILSAGTTALTASFTPADTTHNTSATASVPLQVNKATPAVSWQTPAAIPSGTALSATQLNASASVPGSFTYSPAAGTVPAVGTVSLQATFTPTDTTDYSSATTSVSLTVSAVNKTTPTITWPSPAAISYGTALSATQLDARSSVVGTFSYSPAAGVVPGAGTTSLQVTFTPSDTTSYTSATASTPLQVNKATPTVTWPNPASIPSGTALSATQLNASASVPGSFTYSPAAGTVPAVGTVALQATFTPTDTTDYSSVTTSASLTVSAVNKTTPTITWPSPAAIPYGTALSATQLDARSSVAGTFSYSPAAGVVPGAGSSALQVTFTPTDTTSYTSATASTSLQVTQATPQISWAAPAAITSGTALSSGQLNASSNVPGTFTYSPAAGNVPAAGTTTLQATFTPTDATDYSTARATVSLTVNPASAGPVAILSPVSGATVSGVISVTGQIKVTLDPAGSHLLVDGAAYGYNVNGGPYIYSLDTTTLANGTHTIQIWAHDIGNNVVVSPPVTINVQNSTGKTTPTIIWAAPAPFSYGTALSSAQLNASTSVAGTFSFSPAAGTVLSAGTHTLTATFTPTNTSTYAPATASTSIQVTQVASQLSWPTPAAISAGTPLSSAQLDATANVAGSFSYSPAAGTVPGAGTSTLQVTFTPADSTDYASATASVALTVNAVSKTTPTLSWSTPAAMTAGNTLSPAQLDAVASVPGTFSYTPAAGTLLSAGTTPLSVTFTPTDSTHFNSATASVALTVNPASVATGPLAILSPTSGVTVSGTISITALCQLNLDPAGTHLLVDGAAYGYNINGGPFIYSVNTATLSNGPHLIQVWAHDIGNNVTVSPGITIIVAN